MAAPVEITLTPLARKRLDIVELFGLQDPGGGEMTVGWVEIEASQTGLVSAADLRLFGEQAMTKVSSDARLPRGRAEVG